MPKKPPDNVEVERILEVTKTLLRVMGLSNREIERRLGMSPSYLTRVFSGYVEVKLEHVLDIAQAMGLRPAEFFSFVYPELPEPPSPAAETLRSRLANLQPGQPAAPPPPAPVDAQELDRLIDERLRRFFRKMRDKTG